jgi:exodeoxyribonuclease VII large subunit
MQPAGEGALQAAFIKLREMLKAEGLFDTERKKPIPAFARCVAIVTSPTGAALQDMIKIIRHRNPTVKIVVSPALVQGAGGAADIARAIAEGRRLYRGFMGI